MNTWRIADQATREALFVLVDDDIASAAREEHAVVERAEIAALIAEELGDLAGVDALVENAERELAAVHLAETFRVAHELTDPVRARRAHRRAVLRGLAADAGEAA